MQTVGSWRTDHLEKGFCLIHGSRYRVRRSMVYVYNQKRLINSALHTMCIRQSLKAELVEKMFLPSSDHKGLKSSHQMNGNPTEQRKETSLLVTGAAMSRAV